MTLQAMAWGRGAAACSTFWTLSSLPLQRSLSWGGTCTLKCDECCRQAAAASVCKRLIGCRVPAAVLIHSEASCTAVAAVHKNND
jgi:hypothetical protein